MKEVIYLADKPSGENREEFLEYLKKFCLLDDTFMRKYFEKTECVEEILRIILNNKDLKVIQSNTQHVIANLQGKEVQLDIYAIADENVRYDVEVENSKKRAVPKRTRYYSSLIDANILKKGDDFTKLPESYVIFITKSDYFDKGLPIYHIKSYIEETKEVFEDERNVIYINASYKDTTTELGKLIHDMNCTKAGDMLNDVLQDRMKQLKESAEGVNDMCALMEELQEKSRLEGIKKGMEKEKENFVVSLLKDNVPKEKISFYTKLSLERILEIEQKLEKVSMSEE